MTSLADKCAEFNAALDDWQIAEALNAPDGQAHGYHTELQKTAIGHGTIMAALGPTRGAAVLDALEALAPVVSSIKWAMRIIDRGELDLSQPAARAQIDALATGAGAIMSQAEADTLKALAEVRRPKSWAEATLGAAVTAADVAAARGKPMRITDPEA